MRWGYDYVPDRSLPWQVLVHKLGGRGETDEKGHPDPDAPKNERSETTGKNGSSDEEEQQSRKRSKTKKKSSKGVTKKNTRGSGQYPVFLMYRDRALEDQYLQYFHQESLSCFFLGVLGAGGLGVVTFIADSFFITGACILSIILTLGFLVFMLVLSRPDDASLRANLQEGYITISATLIQASLWVFRTPNNIYCENWSHYISDQITCRRQLNPWICIAIICLFLFVRPRFFLCVPLAVLGMVAISEVYWSEDYRAIDQGGSLSLSQHSARDAQTTFYCVLWCIVLFLRWCLEKISRKQFEAKVRLVAAQMHNDQQVEGLSALLEHFFPQLTDLDGPGGHEGGVVAPEDTSDFQYHPDATYGVLTVFPTPPANIYGIATSGTGGGNERVDGHSSSGAGATAGLGGTGGHGGTVEVVSGSARRNNANSNGNASSTTTMLLLVHEVTHALDTLAVEVGLTKPKAIGDTYHVCAVAGSSLSPYPAALVSFFALEAFGVVDTVLVKHRARSNVGAAVRIGIHTGFAAFGSCVAAPNLRVQYDSCGEAPLIAQHVLHASCPPATILLSQSTVAHLPRGEFVTKLFPGFTMSNNVQAMLSRKQISSILDSGYGPQTTTPGGWNSTNEGPVLPSFTPAVQATSHKERGGAFNIQVHFLVSSTNSTMSRQLQTQRQHFNLVQGGDQQSSLRLEDRAPIQGARRLSAANRVQLQRKNSNHYAILSGDRNRNQKSVPVRTSDHNWFHEEAEVSDEPQEGHQKNPLLRQQSGVASPLLFLNEGGISMLEEADRSAESGGSPRFPHGKSIVASENVPIGEEPSSGSKEFTVTGLDTTFGSVAGAGGPTAGVSGNGQPKKSGRYSLLGSVFLGETLLRRPHALSQSQGAFRQDGTDILDQTPNTGAVAAQQLVAKNPFSHNAIGGAREDPSSCQVLFRGEGERPEVANDSSIMNGADIGYDHPFSSGFGSAADPFGGLVSPPNERHPSGVLSTSTAPDGILSGTLNSAASPPATRPSPFQPTIIRDRRRRDLQYVPTSEEELEEYLSGDLKLDLREKRGGFLTRARTFKSRTTEAVYFYYGWKTEGNIMFYSRMVAIVVMLFVWWLFSTGINDGSMPIGSSIPIVLAFLLVTIAGLLIVFRPSLAFRYHSANKILIPAITGMFSFMLGVWLASEASVPVPPQMLLSLRMLFGGLWLLMQNSSPVMASIADFVLLTVPAAVGFCLRWDWSGAVAAQRAGDSYETPTFDVPFAYQLEPLGLLIPLVFYPLAAVIRDHRRRGAFVDHFHCESLLKRLTRDSRREEILLGAVMPEHAVEYLLSHTTVISRSQLKINYVSRKHKNGIVVRFIVDPMPPSAMQGQTPSSHPTMLNNTTGGGVLFPGGSTLLLGNASQVLKASGNERLQSAYSPPSAIPPLSTPHTNSSSLQVSPGRQSAGLRARRESLSQRNAARGAPPGILAVSAVDEGRTDSNETVGTTTGEEMTPNSLLIMREAKSPIIPHQNTTGGAVSKDSTGGPLQHIGADSSSDSRSPSSSVKKEPLLLATGGHNTTTSGNNSGSGGSGGPGGAASVDYSGSSALGQLPPLTQSTSASSTRLQATHNSNGSTTGNSHHSNAPLSPGDRSYERNLANSTELLAAIANSNAAAAAAAPQTSSSAIPEPDELCFSHMEYTEEVQWTVAEVLAEMVAGEVHARTKREALNATRALKDQTDAGREKLKNKKQARQEILAASTADYAFPMVHVGNDGDQMLFAGPFFAKRHDEMRFKTNTQVKAFYCRVLSFVLQSSDRLSVLGVPHRAMIAHGEVVEAIMGSIRPRYHVFGEAVHHTEEVLTTVSTTSISGSGPNNDSIFANLSPRSSVAAPSGGGFPLAAAPRRQDSQMTFATETASNTSVAPINLRRTNAPRVRAGNSTTAGGGNKSLTSSVVNSSIQAPPAAAASSSFHGGGISSFTTAVAAFSVAGADGSFPEEVDRGQEYNNPMTHSQQSMALSTEFGQTAGFGQTGANLQALSMQLLSQPIGYIFLSSKIAKILEGVRSTDEQACPPELLEIHPQLLASENFEFARQLVAENRASIQNVVHYSHVQPNFGFNPPASAPVVTGSQPLGGIGNFSRRNTLSSQHTGAGGALPAVGRQRLSDASAPSQGVPNMTSDLETPLASGEVPPPRLELGSPVSPQDVLGSPFSQQEVQAPASSEASPAVPSRSAAAPTADATVPGAIPVSSSGGSTPAPLSELTSELQPSSSLLSKDDKEEKEHTTTTRLLGSPPVEALASTAGKDKTVSSFGSPVGSCHQLSATQVPINPTEGTGFPFSSSEGGSQDLDPTPLGTTLNSQNNMNSAARASSERATPTEGIETASAATPPRVDETAKNTPAFLNAHFGSNLSSHLGPSSVSGSTSDKRGSSISLLDGSGVSGSTSRSRIGSDSGGSLLSGTNHHRPRGSASFVSPMGDNSAGGVGLKPLSPLPLHRGEALDSTENNTQASSIPEPPSIDPHPDSPSAAPKPPPALVSNHTTTKGGEVSSTSIVLSPQSNPTINMTPVTTTTAPSGLPTSPLTGSDRPGSTRGRPTSTRNEIREQQKKDSEEAEVDDADHELEKQESRGSLLKKQQAVSIGGSLALASAVSKFKSKARPPTAERRMKSQHSIRLVPGQVPGASPRSVDLEGGDGDELLYSQLTHSPSALMKPQGGGREEIPTKPRRMDESVLSTTEGGGTTTALGSGALASPRIGSSRAYRPSSSRGTRIPQPAKSPENSGALELTLPASEKQASLTLTDSDELPTDIGTEYAMSRSMAPKDGTLSSPLVGGMSFESSADLSRSSQLVSSQKRPGGAKKRGTTLLLSDSSGTGALSLNQSAESSSSSRKRAQKQGVVHQENPLTPATSTTGGERIQSLTSPLDDSAKNLVGASFGDEGTSPPKKDDENDLIHTMLEQ